MSSAFWGFVERLKNSLDDCYSNLVRHTITAERYGPLRFRGLNALKFDEIFDIKMKHGYMKGYSNA
jgi:hypothetical protein